MADISKPLNITATPLPAIIPSNPLQSVGVADGSISVSLPVTKNIIGNVDITTIAVAIRGLGEEIIPDPGLFKFLADKFGTTESSLLHAYKQLPELVKGTDLRSVVAKKVLSEISSIREQVRIHSRIGVQDIRQVSDLYYANLAKSVASQGKTRDTLDKYSSKTLLDIKTTTEKFSKLVAIVLTEVDYFLQDGSLFKGAAHLTDALSAVVQYKRTLNTAIGTTDDFYGIANLDDDQLATFYKVLVDWTSISEALVLWAEKAPVSYTSATDHTSLLAGKQLDSNTSSNDTSISYSANKPLDTSYSILDSINKHASILAEEDSFLTYDRISKRTRVVREDIVYKQDITYTSYSSIKVAQVGTIDAAFKELSTYVLDTKYLTDIFTTQYSKLNFDSLALTETSQKWQYKSILEGGTLDEKYISTSDSVSTVSIVARNFTELIDATDDFYGSANIDDDRISAFGKGLVDAYLVSEFINTQINFMRDFSSLATGSDAMYSLLSKDSVKELVTGSDYRVFNSHKAAVDNILAADTLHLNVQNYSLERYAVVGYVGQTFVY